jgi:hypothetical protein
MMSAGLLSSEAPLLGLYPAIISTSPLMAILCECPLGVSVVSSLPLRVLG